MADLGIVQIHDLRFGPDEEARMTTTPATVAIVGAGDYIGAAIARRFAAGGYTVVLGRRNGDKLGPPGRTRLRQPADAPWGGRLTPGARRRSQPSSMRPMPRRPLAACIFNVGGNVRFPIRDTTERGLPQGLGDGLLCGLPHRP
jgi:NAD(P)-dependent dehydrogenase (short-subunit alcohol dehydrogenase family)